MILDAFKKFAEKYDMFPHEGLVLAAVSGGSDSMCLLDLLRRYAPEYGFAVAAMHFDHHLRGEESDRDAAFVKAFCLENSVACHMGGGDVAAFSKKNGLGTEAAAREMRYAFFAKTAQDTGAGRIATAHNANDNAETVLMNLTRGAGLRGLCGIPPVRGIIIRPLLDTSRDDIVKYLEARGVPHVEDSSNSQCVYTRNKIRHSVIPVLKCLNPRLAESVAATSELLREDEEYLRSCAEGFIASRCSGNSADAKALSELPKSIASRVIRIMSGTKLSAAHVAAVLALCSADDPSGEVSLPLLTVYREYGRIIFGQYLPLDCFAPVEVASGETAVIPELGYKVICTSSIFDDKVHKSLTTFLFKTREICGKIIIRSRISGDNICLDRRNGTKSLKKLFIEKRIPLRKRALIPVVADDNGVLAVYGLGTDKRVVPYDGDPILVITFEEIV